MATGVLLTPPIIQFFSNAGIVAANGSVLTQVGGLNTATYQDVGLTTPLPNPIPLNSRGEVSTAAGASAQCFLTPNTTYVFTLYDGPNATGNQLWQATYVNGVQTSLTQAQIGAILYPQTAAEITAGITPTTYVYPMPDLRRYGADITGVADSTTAINNAISVAQATGGPGYIYHPGGTILHASTITIPSAGGVSIIGFDRNGSIFTYSGTGDGWKYSSGVHNSSGYAKVNFRSVKIVATNAANAGAGIEINAGGYSYFQITDCWIFNKWAYGIILDAAEIVVVNRSLVDLAGPTAAIWIVDGADRTASQGPGFTNVITIRDNQISSTGGIGLIDDGGNNHVIEGNNFNSQSVPLRAAGCNSLSIIGNSFETHAATGANDLLFSNVTNAGNVVGSCTNVLITSNTFAGDMAAAGTQLAFKSTTFSVSGATQANPCVVTLSTVSATNPFATIASSSDSPVTFSGVTGMTQLNGLSAIITGTGGVSGAWTITLGAVNSTAFNAYVSGGTVANYHSGVSVCANVFTAVAGRGNAIDVTYLANSFCGWNTDLTVSSSASHYTGVHNDALGNSLLAPQNGFIGTSGLGTPTQENYGDTRFRKAFAAAVQFTWAVVPYSASMTFDLGTANHFDITANNGSNFTINSPNNANQGNRFSVTIRNTSGGALGTVTWGASFKTASGIAYPANTNQRTYDFLVDSGGVSHQVTAAADVPN